MAKRAYIVLQHSFVPAPGANTSMKNFGTEGQWQMVEEIFFVTRIRKRWWQEATTIVNITDGVIETNRSETRDYSAIVQHVMMKYPEHYNSFVDECKENGILRKGE
jgi:hypothetical protein